MDTAHLHGLCHGPYLKFAAVASHWQLVGTFNQFRIWTPYLLLQKQTPVLSGQLIIVVMSLKLWVWKLKK